MKGKLEQGKFYNFKVIKLVSMDMNDGDQFWVLEDPFGFRQLLNAEYYNHYAIQPGLILNCKVDKINCTGRIFLEPLNPKYSVGQLYSFPVVACEMVKDKFILTVEDEFFAKHTVTFTENPGKTAICKVDKIKKAKLYLSDPNAGDNVWFDDGKNYSFKVVEIKDTPDCGECFFLEDDQKRTHILPTENYVQYNIKKSDTISCTVISQSESGRCTLEPVHPIYTPGELHSFEVLELKFEKSYNEQYEWVLYVLDKFGNKILLAIDDNKPDEFQNCTRVVCQIDRVKKGRVFLINPSPDSIR